MVRAFIAIKLSEKEHMSQKKIAEYLGVSQPVISGYLRQKRQLPAKLSPLTTIIEEMVDAFSMKYKDGERSSQAAPDFLSSICTVCKNTRINGSMCSVHKQYQENLPENCSICITTEKIKTIQERKRLLKKELLTAARTIFSNEEIVALIPEIGCQFAVLYTQKKKLTANDVMSFPGRIIKYKNQAKILSPPNFGESNLSSELLLQFYQEDPNKTSLLILKNTKKLRQVLESLQTSEDIRVIFTTAADKKWDTLFESLKPYHFDVLSDKGAPGFESLIYFFERSPQHMQKRVKMLLERLS